MEHPFLSSSTIDDKSPEAIQKIIGDLIAKFNFASRSGNRQLSHQLQMVLESYQNAYQKKMDEMMKKQNVSDKINISR
jgi:hypothetical protein